MDPGGRRHAVIPMPMDLGGKARAVIHVPVPIAMDPGRKGTRGDPERGAAP
ncbi:hypothetical protein Nmel_011954, partial [Mimus melanotis]